MSRTPPRDFTDAQIQDIATALAPLYTGTQLEDVLRYFDALDIATEAANSDQLPRAGSKKETLQNWLRVANGRPVGRKILAYMIENRQLRKDKIEALEDALSGSRFVLAQGDNGAELHHRINATAEDQLEEQRAYVEERAPDDVRVHIEKAEDKLTRGEYAEAMAEAREALATLAGGDYNAGLDELCKKGIIKQWDGDGNPKRYDREMLYMSYGYCSTLGSHRGDPSKLQAETGVILVEEAVHFLLRVTEDAKESGKQLDRWIV